MSARNRASSTFEPLDGRGASFAAIGGDVDDDADSNKTSAASQAATRAAILSAVLLALNLYFDSSIPLWQKLYKESRKSGWSNGCSELQDLFDTGKTDGVASLEFCLVRDNCDVVCTNYACPFAIQYVYDKEESKCKWQKSAMTFTKGTALSIQAFCGTLIFWAVNYMSGGMDQLRLCWDIRRAAKFALPGLLFGLAGVFSFLGQDALSPGSYSLYAQTGIIAVPVMWRLYFNRPLPVLSWIHILIIGAGIVMYRMSEVDMSEQGTHVNEEDVAKHYRGLVYVACKVMFSGFASVWSESFLKGQSDVPFTVQVSYILPWKMITCIATIWLLPPYGLPGRAGGFFHDWNFLTVWIVFTNLGDDVMSAVIARRFDSVVKAICAVFGIIFPTWVISFAAGWEKLDVYTSSGQLKAAGGVVVILTSFAYVFGRAQSNQIDELLERVASLSPIGSARTLRTEKSKSSDENAVELQGRAEPLMKSEA